MIIKSYKMPNKISKKTTKIKEKSSKSMKKSKNRVARKRTQKQKKVKSLSKPKITKKRTRKQIGGEKKTLTFMYPSNQDDKNTPSEHTYITISYNADQDETTEVGNFINSLNIALFTEIETVAEYRYGNLSSGNAFNTVKGDRLPIAIEILDAMTTEMIKTEHENDDNFIRLNDNIETIVEGIKYLDDNRKSQNLPPQNQYLLAEKVHNIWSKLGPRVNIPNNEEYSNQYKEPQVLQTALNTGANVNNERNIHRPEEYVPPANNNNNNQAETHQILVPPPHTQINYYNSEKPGTGTIDPVIPVVYSPFPPEQRHYTQSSTSSSGRNNQEHYSTGLLSWKKGPEANQTPPNNEYAPKNLYDPNNEYAPGNGDDYLPSVNAPLGNQQRPQSNDYLSIARTPQAGISGLMKQLENEAIKQPPNRSVNNILNELRRSSTKNSRVKQIIANFNGSNSKV